MTRFARAKGSKSSNERVPEQATSWSEMRRDLHRESVRKAAEEQIERESRLQHQQNFEKRSFDMPATKKKVTEPVELVSFEDVPCVSNQSSQASAHAKQSFTQKEANKIKTQEVSQIKRPHPDSVENSEDVDQKKNIPIAQRNDSVKFESFINQSTALQISDADSSSACIKRKDREKNAQQIDKHKTSANRPISAGNNKRKPNNQHKSSKESDELKIGGNFKGYPVPVEDAETLTDAYNILRKEGLTHKQAMERIKPERRRAEKRLARLKSTICFRCRKPGHRLSDCPIGGIDCAVCFKCGSTTHKYQDCKKKGSFVNAKCFICGVVGHLSAQCPENSHGVYPEGGECKICGEKSHLVKDCPQNRNRKEQLHAGTTEFDDYFDEKSPEPVKPPRKKIKKVQF